MNKKSTVKSIEIKENEKINFDDIPELTKEDFTRGVKNPFAGKLKDGYTIIINHADHEEIIKVSKKRRPKRKEKEINKLSSI